MKKIFIIRKYILADSIKDALKKEKRLPPDDVYLDETYRTKVMEQLVPQPEAVGFKSKKKK